MSTAQQTNPARCRVLLHPTAMHNPGAIRAVQQATGGLIVINGGRARLNAPTAAPGSSDTGPFGGDAA